MSKQKSKETQLKIVRKKYTPEFKDQALALIKRDGVPKVAKDLGLSDCMLYSWRTKQANSGEAFEVQKLKEGEAAHLRYYLKLGALRHGYQEKCTFLCQLRVAVLSEQ